MSDFVRLLLTMTVGARGAMPRMALLLVAAVAISACESGGPERGRPSAQEGATGPLVTMETSPSARPSAASASTLDLIAVGTLYKQPDEFCDSIGKSSAEEAVGGHKVATGWSASQGKGPTLVMCEYSSERAKRGVSWMVADWNAKQFAARKRRADTSYKRTGMREVCSRGAGIFGDDSYTSRCVLGDPLNSLVFTHAAPAGDASFTCSGYVQPDDEAGARKRIDAFCTQVARALSG